MGGSVAGFEGTSGGARSAGRTRWLRRTRPRYGRRDPRKRGLAPPAHEAFTFLDEARLLQSYRLATLILRDRDEAEDATQEAIVRAWSSWGTLRDRSRFDAWFDRILVNICRNRMRHTRTLRVVALEDALELQATDRHGESAARLVLEPAFARLSPDQGIIIVLRFWRDLSVDAIAERLGIPAGTVKSRLHYALETLRGAIESSEEAAR